MSGVGLSINSSSSEIFDWNLGACPNGPWTLSILSKHWMVQNPTALTTWTISLLSVWLLENILYFL